MKNISVVLLTVAVGFGLAFGCGGKKKQKKKAADAPTATTADKQATPPAAPPASPFGGGTMGMIGQMLKAGLDAPGLYDEPRESDGFSLDKDHYAVLELSGDVVELRSFSLMGGMSGTSLRTLMDRLDKLAANKHLRGLLLRSGDLGMSMATAEELREALVAFKGNGKRKLVCHTEGLSNVTYYLMSACDSIGLAPTGQVLITGVAAMPMHVKGLLDKVGVRADFLHVGAFKGAAEPLTRQAPSPQMLATLDGIMEQSYQTLVTGIASGRKLKPAKVRSLIDTAVFQSEAAVKDKLVDKVAVYEAYRDATIGKAGWKKVKLTEKKAAGWGAMMEFLGLMPATRPTAPHVAVVYAVGGVVDGKGGGGIGGPRTEIASRPLAAAFRALAADDSVKAIVLRIDSGGGSALASEIIWHAVSDAKKKKPVIVSMAGVAASGGYYIGAGATKIYANANTLTGSIGVVGGKLAIGGALEKVGVKAYPRGKGKRSLMWTTMKPWSPAERVAVQSMMEGIYKVFVKRVAAGRGKSYDQVHTIAQGRVWTGAAAKKRGLVDEIGGLKAAIADARKLGGVAADAPLEIYPAKPSLKTLIGSFGEASLPFGLDNTVLQVAKLLGPAEAKVIEQLLHQLVSLQTQRVQTAMYLPVVFR